MIETDPPGPPGRMTLARVLRLVVLWVLAVSLAHALDGWAHGALAFEGAEGADWGRALRVLGYVPVWVAVALVLWVEDGPRLRAGRPAHLVDRWSRGAIVLGSALMAGALAELGKLLLRRERPPDAGRWDGVYSFKAFGDNGWSTGGIGLPSSHAAVAMGGALAIAALWPRHRWWALALGAGCAFQRVSAGAHFVSDVAAAALVAAFAAAIVWRAHWWLLRRRVFGGRAAGDRG